MATCFNPFYRYTDLNGDILQGRLRFLDPDTDALKAVYSDYTGDTPITNPVVLNNEGMVSDNGVWLKDGYYKIQVQSYQGLDGNGDPVYSTEYEIDYLGEAASSAAATGDVTVVSTLAALRALPAATAPDTVYMLGYLSAYDGGGGYFKWSSANTNSDDAGAVIAVNDSPSVGRYLRINFSKADVRYWGAIPGIATHMNGSIVNARNYAQAQGMTLYFPSGKFQVTGATLSVYTRVEMNETTTFKNVSAITSYVIDFNNSEGTGWKLPKASLASGDSTGLVYPSFINAVSDQDASPVYAENWPQFSTLCQHCGGQPVIFTENYSGGDIGESSFTLPHAIFKDSGKITFNCTGVAGVATFSQIDVIGGTYSAPIIDGTLPLITINCDVRASWFGEFQARTAMRYWTITGNMHLDLDITIDDTSVSNQWLCRVVPVGDYKTTVNSGLSLTIDDWCDGKAWLKCESAGHVITTAPISITNFDVSGTKGHEGYIQSCKESGFDAYFSGMVVTGGLDLSGVGSCDIHDINLSGAIIVDGAETVKFYNSSITHTDTVFSGSFYIELYNSFLYCSHASNAPFALTSLTAYDSYISTLSSGTASANYLYLHNTNTQGLTIASWYPFIRGGQHTNGLIGSTQNGSAQINSDIKGASFNGTGISLSGGTTIDTVVIKGNTFKNNSNPISISGCTATSITGVYDISENEPRISDLDNLPSCVVRTTRMDFSVNKSVTFSGTAPNLQGTGAAIQFDPSTESWSACPPGCLPETREYMATVSNNTTGPISAKIWYAGSPATQINMVTWRTQGSGAASLKFHVKGDLF